MVHKGTLNLKKLCFDNAQFKGDRTNEETYNP